MRFYMFAILLLALIMTSSPVPAADDGKLAPPGSSPAKVTPRNYIPPSNHNRPGGGGNHGRPGYDFNKPGRPGDHHPGRPGGGRPGRDRYEPTGADAVDHRKLNYGATPTDSLRYGVTKYPNEMIKSKSSSKSKRRHRRNNSSSWGYDCYPYCSGLGLGYDDDDWYDDRDEKVIYVEPREPERAFEGGGTFERFDDPRNYPTHDDGYPRHSGGAAGQSAPVKYDVDQYHMMMKAWQ